jgi:polyisoprenoid-binding protein YceI
MKKMMIMILFLTAVSLHAETYKLDKAHSRMGFKVPHLMISSVYGNFDSFSGTFDYDGDKNKLSKFKITLDPSSINTSEAKRDNHLRSEDFFDVKKYPEIKFESGEIINASSSPSALKGKLTMHGITKEISLQIKFKGKTKDPWGNQHIVIEVSGTVKRKDFGLNWNKNLDEGGVMIGEEVEIVVEAQGVKI